MAPKSKSVAKADPPPPAKKSRKAAEPPPAAPPAKKGKKETAAKVVESKGKKFTKAKKEVPPPPPATAMEIFGAEMQELQKKTGKKALILGTLDQMDEEEGEDEEEEENEEGEEGEDEDEDEDNDLYEKEATIEELRALPRILISEAQEKIIDDVNEAMSLIGRDGPEDPFRMTNTSDAADAIALIEDTVKQASKVLKASPQEAFAYNLGLTMSCIADDFWLCDNDDPNACNKALKAMRSLWTKLFKLKPEALGITADEVEIVKKVIEKCARSVKEIAEGISGNEDLYTF